MKGRTAKPLVKPNRHDNSKKHKRKSTTVKVVAHPKVKKHNVLEKTKRTSVKEHVAEVYPKAKEQNVPSTNKRTPVREHSKHKPVKKGNVSKKKQSPCGDSWILSMTKNAVAVATSISTSEEGVVESKANRIAKRNSKNKSRLGRKEDERQKREERKNSKKDASTSLPDKSIQSENINETCRVSSTTELSPGMRSVSKRDHNPPYLYDMVEDIRKIVGEVESAASSAHKKLYQSKELSKGKVTSKQQQLTDDALQPRKRDYNGLGLARPSLFLSLRDPSFVPRLENEFSEHVETFFGRKVRSKAMKKQMDGNMLWRRLLREKEEGMNASCNTKRNISVERMDAIIKSA
mmetsp:Transcript_4606/g.5113  ORF Transcript_4606/g.5113 Transcript_4606/m.5113 type:complete len:348 (-) Transcript_4606:194-1237(-)